MLKVAVFAILGLWGLQVLAAPADQDLSFVVTSPEPPSDKHDKEHAPTKPEIYFMHVQSDISNRFAHTTVVSKVRNLAQKAQEASFSVVLPETAFISGFVMEVDGKNYTAYVKEKEEAKREYDQAVSSGLGAAHVAVSARDSNRFTVSVNVEPETKAAFYLSYEQLLKREDGYYEQVINLHPGQPVKDLSIECVISESRKIVDLKTPPLRSGNEISDEKAELDPKSQVELINDTSAIVRFHPDIERQKQLGHLLGSEDDKGLSGQFVVRYDVERDPKGGEVLIQDGYFVHFFAPSDLPVLPKHVVFVLDTSSSMYGDKIVQLKEAMHNILGELHDADLFSLVEFNSNVKVWDLDNPENSVWYPTSDGGYYGPFNPQEAEVRGFEDIKFPPATPVNADNIKKAKETISAMTPTAATDIHTALQVGLHLVALTKTQNPDSNRQPMIVFLTDGDPTVRLTSTSEITNKISEFNSGLRKSPIFALSFGAGADKSFLQKLALRNSGFSKHIYEAADASLQLQDFYKQISSPLLADVTFKYEPSVTSLTITEFPIYFRGSELVVAGWCGNDDLKPPVIDAVGVNEKIHLEPSVTRSVSSMERLWAYLTLKQLLDKKETSEKDQEDLKKKAVDLALKYSFVTPVSSLVVVKPNATNAVDAEDASKPARGPYHQYTGNVQYSGLSAPGQPAFYPAAAFGGGNGGYSRPQYTLNAVSVDSMYFSSDRIAGGIGGPVGLPGIPASPSVPLFLPTNTVPPPIYTTPHKVVASSTKKPDIFDILPWLKDILKDNEVVSTPSGDYKLGLNATVSVDVACPKTPVDGAAGHCSLLHSCPQVHAKLTSADIFNQYMCVLNNEYVGVCCPNP